MVEAKLLRVYLSNTDKFRHMPLYEVIVFAAKRYGIKGATVLKGIMGFGSSSEISSVKFWEVTQKLPLVVEIVDEADKIDGFFATIKPYIEKVPNGCLVTMERVDVALYKSGGRKRDKSNKIKG
jgi:PII-like signaling protein